MRVEGRTLDKKYYQDQNATASTYSSPEKSSTYGPYWTTKKQTMNKDQTEK